MNELEIILNSRILETQYDIEVYVDSVINDILDDLDRFRRIGLTSTPAFIKQNPQEILQFIRSEINPLQLDIEERLRAMVTYISRNFGVTMNNIISFDGAVDGFESVMMSEARLMKLISGKMYNGIKFGDFINRILDTYIISNIESNIRLYSLDSAAVISQLRANLVGAIPTELAMVAHGYGANTQNLIYGEIYAANMHLVQKVRWNSVMELGNKKSGRGTCIRCAALDGQIFEKGNHPECPLHPRCRCWLTPVVDRDFVDRAIAEQEIYDRYRDPSVLKFNRGSKGVSIRHDFGAGSFSEYFAGMSSTAQMNMLGPRRYDLWKSGKVGFSDFVDRATGELVLIRDL